MAIAKSKTSIDTGFQYIIKGKVQRMAMKAALLGMFNTYKNFR